MGRFRDTLMRLHCRLRRGPLYVSHQLAVFRRGRGCVKYSFFYRYMSVVIFLQSLVSLCIALAMLWPTATNDMFDFETSPLKNTQNSLSDVCGVGTHSLFAFWKGLQHYGILAQFLFAQCILFFATGVMMLLLSFGYSHFADLPREHFGHSSFRTRWLGYFCKTFPSLLKFTYIVTFVFVFLPFFLVVINSTCERRVSAFADLVRIHNCRAWVFDCVKDTRLFGRQLACSLASNYKAFPVHYCLHNERCYFPTGVYKSKQTVQVPSGICSGEDRKTPVPRCAMADEARADLTSGVGRRNRKSVEFDDEGTSLLQTQSTCLDDNCMSHSIWEGAPWNILNNDLNLNVSFLQTDEKEPQSSKRTYSNPLLQKAKEAAAAAAAASSESVQSLPSSQPKSLDSQQEEGTLWSRVRSAFRNRNPDRGSVFTPIWLPQTKEQAFHTSFHQTFYLMHQGSMAGRILYGWFFCSFVLFILTRIIGLYLQKSILEDASFLSPPRGGQIRRFLHRVTQQIGL